MNGQFEKSFVIEGKKNKIKNAAIIDKQQNVKIDITKEKRKSFRNGFLSGVIASLVASAIWYFFQRIIETN